MHVFVSVKLTNPLTGDSVSVPDALVDTGATWTTVPGDIAEKLKLQPYRVVKVRTASGFEELGESLALVDIEDNGAVSPVWMNPKLERVLIGVLTLEAMALKVDPATGKLEKTELLLY